MPLEKSPLLLNRDTSATPLLDDELLELEEPPDEELEELDELEEELELLQPLP
jgi:hypothetical protein